MDENMCNKIEEALLLRMNVSNFKSENELIVNTIQYFDFDLISRTRYITSEFKLLLHYLNYKILMMEVAKF